MLPDKALFGEFGPKNTKSCQNLNMVQDSDAIVLLVNLSTNVPHVTEDQLHQEVGPGSEWPPSFKLSFQNIFASDSKSVQILTSHKCVMRRLISLQSSLN